MFVTSMIERENRKKVEKSVFVLNDVLIYKTAEYTPLLEEETPIIYK